MKTMTTNLFHSLMKRASVLFALALLLPFFLQKAEASPAPGQDDETAVVRQETELPSGEVDPYAYRVFSKKEIILSFMILYAVIQLLCHEKKDRKEKDENGRSPEKSRKKSFRTGCLPILLCILYFVVMAILATIRGG